MSAVRIHRSGSRSRPKMWQDLRRRVCNEAQCTLFLAFSGNQRRRSSSNRTVSLQARTLGPASPSAWASGRQVSCGWTVCRAFLSARKTSALLPPSLPNIPDQSSLTALNITMYGMVQLHCQTLSSSGLVQGASPHMVLRLSEYHFCVDEDPARGHSHWSLFLIQI